MTIVFRKSEPSHAAFARVCAPAFARDVHGFAVLLPIIGGMDADR